MNANTSGGQDCECHRCIDEKGLLGIEAFGATLPLNACMIIVCDQCGHKRCPRANNHHNQCTQSNELGQKGSAYE